MSHSRLPFAGAHWVDSVALHAFTNPDGTALRFEGETITWSQLNGQVRRLASALAGRGVAKGDRVAILMTNRPEFVVMTIAANALGAIAVPINFRLAPGEVAYVLEDSGSKLLFTDTLLKQLAVASAGPVPVITVGEDYADLVASGHADDVPEVDINERDVALIMYTSGTTGRPKGAMLSHLNLLMQTITSIRTARAFGEDGVSLCNVPLFHIAGIGGMPPSILIGTPTVIMPTGLFEAQSTLDIVESEGITGLFLVPAQWQVLCEHPEATKKSATLRTISWGAAPATVSLLEKMSATFPHCEIISVFGQTEMSPVTTHLPPEEAIRKIGSVGKPVPTIAVRIVDDEMNDVAPGEVGEIVYRGPTLMAGYWNKPEETAAAFHGGWFHSGDLVRADDEGFIYVVDRKKDMIISGGENIYCAEVENAIAGHPEVIDVAVIGAKHERWGETPIAVVVPADADAPPTIEDINAFIVDKLASYKKPTGVVVLPELPRNAAGKVLKHQLRAEYGDSIIQPA